MKIFRILPCISYSAMALLYRSFLRICVEPSGIELDPYLQFVEDEVVKETLEENQRNNPFHAWYSFLVMSNVLQSLEYESDEFEQILKKENYSEAIIKWIMGERKEFKKWLEAFAHKINLNIISL